MNEVNMETVDADSVILAAATVAGMALIEYDPGLTVIVGCADHETANSLRMALRAAASEEAGPWYGHLQLGWRNGSMVLFAVATEPLPALQRCHVLWTHGDLPKTFVDALRKKMGKQPLEAWAGREFTPLLIRTDHHAEPPKAAPRPHLGAPVHYLSFGTPNGEYEGTCRAAWVTEVGQWVTTKVHRQFTISANAPEHAGMAYRNLEQVYDPEAIAAFVANPTGTFHNGAGTVACLHDEPGPGKSAKSGTWHWPHQ